ncbi:MAG: xylulokinase [Candidatus Latescibacterota bacterium]
MSGVRNLLGIDLGTSSVRAGIYREDGARLSIAARAYPIEAPSPEIAEQNPELWWRNAGEAVHAALALAGLRGADIAGVSFSGQMHGGVMLDRRGEPVGNAVIWADSRSAGECREIEDALGPDILRNTLMNRIFPGTFAATAYWMQKHDRARWNRVRTLLPPKDYLRWRMCGALNSDPSDASATLLFDQTARNWSPEVLERLGIPMEFCPPVAESSQCSGYTRGIEDATGLPDGIPVVTGGADQGAAALGNAMLEEGGLFVAVGTGGQIVTPLREPRNSPGLSLNTFCHLPANRWYLMGATLSAGLSLRWFRDLFAPGIPFSVLDREASSLTPGSGGLIFAPYLAGKRSPALDPFAGGSFQGIRLNHTRAHFVRAILEGVAFDLRDALEVIRNMGVKPERAILSGGGARSLLWAQILADTFNLPLAVSGVDEQACFGAALLAGIGIGVFSDYADAVRVVPKPVRMVEPETGAAAGYEELYEQWRRMG